MSDHIKTRRTLYDMYDLMSFEELISRVILSDEEKVLLRLRYIDAKDFGFIASVMDMSVSTVYKKHKKALKKIRKYKVG